jgi:hypothetical protein
MKLKVSEMEAGDVFKSNSGWVECLEPAARNERRNFCMEVFAADIGQHKMEFDGGSDPKYDVKKGVKLPRVRARERTFGPAAPTGAFR